MAKSADAFRTISEVADWLETPAHVLRFWESKFSQVKPVKRAGGRRYYRPADMKLLGGIKQLLHEDGLTIKGVQKILREQGVKHVAGLSQPLDELTEAVSQDQDKDITLDVVEEAPRGTADVVSFRAEPEKPAPSAPAADADADADADAEQEAAQAKIRQEAAAKAAAASQAEADATTSAMPSFMQRRPMDDVPPPGEDSAKTDDVPEAPSERAILSLPDLPDDPGDDIDAAPGPLTELAKITTPVSPDALAHLQGLAAQLGSGDMHLDS
jgi:DNA-binding transcriptional MerR regulator